jgi:hypothetical protein
MLSASEKERPMRRMILAGFALVAAVTVFDMPGAQAQVATPRNPWCIRDGALGPGSWDCSYRTFEQCRYSVEGAGGSCSRNPEWPGWGFNRRQGEEPWGGGGTWGYGGGWGHGSGRW